MLFRSHFPKLKGFIQKTRQECLTTNISILSLRFRLSPAYDLLNTHLHINDGIFAMSKGLFVNPEPDYFGGASAVTGKTFYHFGLKIGLPERLVNSCLEKYSKIYELTDQLIEHSFLSKELKKQYRLMYKSRVGSYLSVIE